MPRFTASLLLLVVGLMAWLPQALCPCAVAGRACSLRQGSAQAVQAKACCPRCRPARPAAPAPASQALAGQAPCGQDRDTCLCCELNGDGKMLVPMGATVRAEAGEPALDLPALVASHLGRPLPLARQEVAPQAHSRVGAAPHERRAGVVLQI